MKATSGNTENGTGNIACITLEDGLIGIPSARRFNLVVEQDSPFHWLQCVDEPAIALPVIDPLEFVEDYTFDLTTGDAERLTIQTPDEVVVLTTVTIEDNPKRVTTNLLGPIVFNRTTLQGKQIVLSSENYSTKYILYEADGVAHQPIREKHRVA